AFLRLDLAVLAGGQDEHQPLHLRLTFDPKHAVSEISVGSFLLLTPIPMTVLRPPIFRDPFGCHALELFFQIRLPLRFCLLGFGTGDAVDERCFDEAPRFAVVQVDGAPCAHNTMSSAFCFVVSCSKKSFSPRAVRTSTI